LLKNRLSRLAWSNKMPDDPLAARLNVGLRGFRANPLNLTRVMPAEGNEMDEQASSCHHRHRWGVRGPRMHGADDDMASV
jgi:hypothetical protein